MEIGFKVAAALMLVSFGASVGRAQQKPRAPNLKHYIYVVMTNPVAGKDAEFNNWYTNTHLKDVMKLPGVVSAQRFVVAPENINPAPYRYLAIYDIEISDLSIFIKAQKDAINTPAMVLNPAFDLKGVYSLYFQKLTNKVVADHSNAFATAHACLAP